MSDTTNTQAIIETAIQAATPSTLDDDGRFLSLIVPEGASQVTIDLAELEEKTALNPRRKAGTVHIQSAAAFVDYVVRNGADETQIYADQSRRRLVAVLNDHEFSEPSDDTNEARLAGHRDYRCSLELITSKEWGIWATLDKTWVEPIRMAEHLEDNGIDVIDPDVATMLEVAQTIQGATSVDWKYAERLDNGQVQIRFEETVQARAGQSGELEIPTRFVINVPPFVGAPPVEVEARFRYRIRGGQLSLSYALAYPDRVVEEAFLSMVTFVDDSLDAPVYLGRPE